MSVASNSDLYRKLEPVQRHLNWNIALRCASEGFAGGAALAATVLLCGIVLFPQTAIYIGMAALLAGPAVGGFAAVMLKKDIRVAARFVDQHYDLKDRAVTALHNLGKKSPSPVEIYQLRDTLEHLKNIEPTKVVPLSLRAAKRPLLRGTILTAVAVALMLGRQWGDFSVAAGIMPSKPAAKPTKTAPLDVAVSPDLVRQSLQGQRRDDGLEGEVNIDAMPQGERDTILRYFRGAATNSTDREKLPGTP